jgi:hypothetical protein
MNCWHCNTQLVWGGDHDLEDEAEEYIMVYHGDKFNLS